MQGQEEQRRKEQACHNETGRNERARPRIDVQFEAAAQASFAVRWTGGARSTARGNGRGPCRWHAGRQRARAALRKPSARQNSIASVNTPSRVAPERGLLAQKGWRPAVGAPS